MSERKHGVVKFIAPDGRYGFVDLFDEHGRQTTSHYIPRSAAVGLSRGMLVSFEIEVLPNEQTRANNIIVDGQVPRVTGTVCFVARDRAFGFVNADGGRGRTFIPPSFVSDPLIVKGTRIEFDLYVRADGKTNANRVTIISPPAASPEAP